ncbi:hypothetical protein T265_06609 [Opisthorchis viverrini]|uniref:Uncharacterized protein n=1 Tax=Opisthorchis viverrini TaxID=6198 RepID=A0A075ADI5_OPIVI|nr:hypothetical protein T265_06609 [Opisthorchis viverrini]KER26079.1 hypothetical protein T265_06609 [Opisthorchis viverrini]
MRRILDCRSTGKRPIHERARTKVPSAPRTYQDLVLWGPVCLITIGCVAHSSTDWLSRCPRFCGRKYFIIVIMNSVTSVFNTDASLAYNHDLFKSLIVKKRVNVNREWT